MKFKKGDKVLCWDESDEDKYERYYAFYADGKHWVYPLMGNDSVVTFDHIEPINPNQSKIKELEATIKKAQEQIEELKNL